MSNRFAQWTRRSFVVLALGAIVVAAQDKPAALGIPQVRPHANHPTTIVFVRHAEKGTDDPKDPSLSDVGKKRAAAIAKLLSREKPTHIFASEYKRTKQTIEPFATACKIAITERPAANTAKLIAELASLPEGSFAVVVGHSNTIPKIVAELGGEMRGLTQTADGPCIPDDEYGRVVVLTIPNCPGAAPATLELQAGE